MVHFRKENVFLQFLKFLTLLWVLSTSYTDAVSGKGRTLPHHSWRKEKVLIRNERVASNGEYPYQVSVQVEDDYEDGHTCGGVILDDLTILTAGHCVYNKKYEFKVVAGNMNIKKNINSQIRRVARIYVHPRYTELGDMLENDLALLFLKVPLEFNEFVQPIDLPYKDSYPSGDAIVTGWGYTSIRNGRPEYPDELHVADVLLMSPLNCANAIGKQTKVDLDSGVVLCTGKYDGFAYSSEVSKGDSGGGLVQNGKVIGIVSLGNDEITIYARVSKFVDWIIKRQELYRASRIPNPL